MTSLSIATHLLMGTVFLYFGGEFGFVNKGYEFTAHIGELLHTFALILVIFKHDKYMFKK